MPTKNLVQKLMIKEGRTLLLVNPPKEYAQQLGELPKNVKLLRGATEPADIIQVFVRNQKELAEQLRTLKPRLVPNGILWVSYLKGTSKIPTDINRDTIRAYGQTVGLEGVSLIAVNEDWSAMRFKII